MTIKDLNRVTMLEVLGAEYADDPEYHHEFVFSRPINLVIVKVLSGIPRMSNFNEQQIRIRVVHGVSLKTMLLFTVPIDERWRQVLGIRMAQIEYEVRAIRYCECGGLLFRQRGRHGKFEACTNCEYTEQVHTTFEVEETYNRK